MSRTVRFVGVCAVTLGSVAAVNCTTGGASSSKVPTPLASNSAQVLEVAQSDAAEPDIVYTPRPAPPTITKPMPGEPEAPALSEARLISLSCENYQQNEKKNKQELVKKMRAEVDASIKEWVSAQPGCWADYRQQYEMESGAMFGRSYAMGAGAGVGSSAGFGGLSLSGVGSGGGGTGSGSIGLGAVRKDSNSQSSTPSRTAKSMSGTNNQVEGVDEADMVKTDGKYVYLVLNGALRILEAMNPKVLSVTKVEGNVREMFIEGDRAIVYSSSGQGGKRCTYGYDCTFAGDGTNTKITLFDITSRYSPKALRQVKLSGSLMAARRIGTTIHTVVADGDPVAPLYKTWPDDVETCGMKEGEVRAKFSNLKKENERIIMAHNSLPTITENGSDKPLCDGLMQTAYSDGQSFTTVASFDLKDDKSPVATSTIQSRPGAVFASNDSLYLSVVHRQKAAGKKWYSFYPSVNEVSEIHKFHIGSNPKDTKYVGSGVVPGHVLNQFSMDEWYGYLRVATSKGKVPDPNVSSSISVLAESENGNLVRVGAINNIAPGEDIRAVRFDGDRGYVVTFKKTDPLFVADLYNPALPKLLGELKIPGFSTYMHRIDPDHLMSIGFDADDKGSFAYFNGIILQMFDVRDPTDPKLIHKEKIGTRGSSSEAATNHLAFNYFAEKGLLAIPMTICEGGGDGRNGNELTFSGLLVYKVSPTKGFSKLGGVNHGTAGAKCDTWWSNANSAVKRSIFLDELVYSIATNKVKVQKLGAFGTDVADLSLLP